MHACDQEFAAAKLLQEPTAKQPTPKASDGLKSMSSYLLPNIFKRASKVQKDSHKGKTFYRLLLLLIVFARLPFNILVNPVFKAFVWFLDPSVPIPSRNEFTGKVVPDAVKEAEMYVRQLLNGVLGVAVSFDLWMSNKTDDVLSLDVHFISPDWVWHHKHLGLLSCNGKTRGTDIAPKLQTMFRRFNLEGRLFAVVKDGGANLNTAATELRKLQSGEFACVALKQKYAYFTTCIAHLINGACNSAVMFIKGHKFQVCFSMVNIISMIYNKFACGVDCLRHLQRILRGQYP